jgi:hypothetical protein
MLCQIEIPSPGIVRLYAGATTSVAISRTATTGKATTVFPGVMEIDYIRVYRRNSAMAK